MNQRLDYGSTAIHAGVPAGITNDRLLADIVMLVDKGHLDSKVLVEWAKRIDSVTAELKALADLVEVHMPHKTRGHCHGLKIGNNRLLGMIMDIHYTQSQFVDEISKVKGRVLKILASKQQLNLFEV